MKPAARRRQQRKRRKAKQPGPEEGAELQEVEIENRGEAIEDEIDLQGTADESKVSIVESKSWSWIAQANLVGHINSQVRQGRQLLSSIAGSGTENFMNGFRRVRDGANTRIDAPAIAGNGKIVVRHGNADTQVDQGDSNFTDATVEANRDANTGTFNNSNNSSNSNNSNNETNYYLTLPGERMTPTAATPRTRLQSVMSALCDRDNNPISRRSFILSIWGTRGRVLDGTCQWIEKNKSYLHWCNSPHSRLLRISGGPGKGKTFLSIYLTEQLEARKPSRGKKSALVYYFFDGKSKELNTAASALKGLIWLLLKKNPGLLGHVDSSDFLNESNDLENICISTVDSLWTIFVKLVMALGPGTVYCVLDGLDECETSSLNELMTRIAYYFNTPQSTPRAALKLLIVSRSESHLCIDELLTDYPQLLLDSDLKEHVDKDIEIFSLAKVEELRQQEGRSDWPDKICEKVKLAFSKDAGGTFLWVAIVARVLKGKRPSEVVAVLDSVPCDLKGLYERMMTKINSTDQEQAHQILQIVMNACRPFTLAELGLLTFDREELDTLKATAGNSQENLSPLEYKMRQKAEKCGFMLNVNVDRKSVALVHETSARKFLRDCFSKEQIAQTNYRVSLTCFTYFQRWFNSHQRRIEKDSVVTIFEDTREEYPLLDYAIRYWAEHLVQAGPQKPIPGFLAASSFCDKRSSHLDNWLQAYWRLTMPYWNCPRSFQMIHLAGYFGFEWLIHHHLSQQHILRHWLGFWCPKRHPANARTNFGMTALHWAARNGHVNAVDMLLQKSHVDIESEGYCMTPLHWAVRNQHTEVVRILLEKGANVEARAFGKTPLLWAASESLEELVRLLLRYDADKEVRVCHIDTPAKMAVVPTALAVFPWANLQYRTAMDESRAELHSQEYGEALRKRKEKARKEAVEVGLIATCAVIILAWQVASYSWLSLRPFFRALGWEVWECITVIIIFLLLWICTVMLHALGYRTYATILSISSVASWAGFVAGWSIMFVAATVTAQEDNDEVISQITSMVVGVLKEWIVSFTLSCLAMVIGTLVKLRLVFWSFIVLLWGIVVIITWVSVPGLLVLIALFSDGNKEWGLLAIPCISLAVAAFAALATGLAVFGDGTRSLKRILLSTWAMCISGLVGSTLICLKPIPPLTGGNIGHATVILLGGSWAAFGGFGATIVSEGVVAIPELIKWLHGMFPRECLGHTPLLFAVSSGHGRIVKMLLENGADVDATDSQQRTPLKVAEEYGHKKVVKIISDHIEQRHSPKRN